MADRMGQPPQTESALISRARAKDQEAFGALVGRYEATLLHVLLPIVGERERARDLVQESILKAWENLHTYVDTHRFSTWFFRIGVNLAISHKRRAKVEHRIFEEHAADPAAGTDPGPSALEALARDEEARAVRLAVGRLPERYANVVRMRYVEGLSCAEIAERLDTTPNTVSLVLFRAKQRLREELSSP